MRRKQFIGRAKECEILLVDPKVSRFHAEIWQRAGLVFIRDLESQNGTFLDGTRVCGEHVLSDKQLRIGELTFEAMACQSPQQTENCDHLMSSTEIEVVGLPAGELTMEGLSDSQRRVLRLLIQGASEKQAAAALGLSPHTIHSHVKGIYRYFNVHSRPELLAMCWTKTGSNQDANSDSNDGKPGKS
jgi:DNA-binding CsgD family transcriptional regulator